ncbi:unnamed protein product, partial [Brassica rapa subsp. trilocularis]
FEKITFRRPEEVSNRSSLPIHDVGFQVEDRKYIGEDQLMVSREMCVAPLIWLNSVFAHMERSFTILLLKILVATSVWCFVE